MFEMALDFLAKLTQFDTNKISTEFSSKILCKSGFFGIPFFGKYCLNSDELFKNHRVCHR